MKSIFLFISILNFFSYTVYSQTQWTIDFEDPSVLYKISIDTNSYPNNIWQIGEPGKPFFYNAHSPTHVIITDTIDPYPINDTSTFVITHLREFGPGAWLQLEFYYKMDSDTLTDFGMIELSINNGSTWYNLMTLDSIMPNIWIETKPSLTGSSPNWTLFSADLSELESSIGFSDTLLYRFTFISDSIQTNKEGWIIDDFQFTDLAESIENLYHSDIISLFPNPAYDFLNIKKKINGNNEAVEVMDLKGRIILINKHFEDEKIDISSLNPGMYLLKYTDTERMAIKRFVVTR